MISLDPLSGHCDPRLYVPLDSGESALAAIAMSLRAGCSPVLLTGPTGIGKTLLLRVLAEREWKSFPRMRLSPRLSLAPEELAGCLLHLLFGKLSAGGPVEAEAALLQELRTPGDRRTLLLVDNIHRTTQASIRKLIQLSQASTPALAIVVAGTNGDDLHALTATLAPSFVVSLPESLPDREIEILYDAIFAHPGLSQRLRYRLATASRDEITRAAIGSPRALKNELARINQDGPPAVRQLPSQERPRAELVRAPLAEVTHLPQEGLHESVLRRVAEIGAQEDADAAPRTRLRLVAAAALAVGDDETHAASPVMVVSPVMAASRWSVPLLALLALGSAVSGAGVTVQHSSTALLRSTTEAVGHSASRLGEMAIAVECAARASLESGRANATRAQATLTIALQVVLEALGRSASQLAESVAAAAHAMKESFLSTRDEVTRRVRAFGVAARGAASAADRMQTSLLRSVTESVDGARKGLAARADTQATRVRRRLTALSRLTRRSGERGRAALASSHAYATRTRTGIRTTTRALTRSGAVGLTRARRAALRVAPRYALSATALLAFADTHSTRVRRRVTALARRSGERGRAALASSHAYATRTRIGIRTTTRALTRSGAVGLTRARRATLRVAPRYALPATALLALALLSPGRYATEATKPSGLALAALDPREVVTLAESVDVQVNARPWAQVRIDGIEVGPTPLRHRLAPGTYQLEAQFPDGRTIQRKIDVGPERRFVSLQ